MINSTYKVLGTTQDVTDCDCCGRVDLKKTVILGILDADGNVEDVVHFGTTCAAHAARRTNKEIKQLAADADKAKRDAAAFEAAQRSDREYREYMTWLTTTTGIADQWQAQLTLGGPLAAHRMYAAHAAA
jgi:hypothetical protein